jgi:ATP-dependent DNA helicase PIF1
MPPHELKLKVGATVMLLRNLNAANGQCNGTRAIIRGIILLHCLILFFILFFIVGLYPYMIDVEIIAGNNIGNRIFLSKINLSTKGNDLPFVLKDDNFPLNWLFVCQLINGKAKLLKKKGFIYHNMCFLMVSFMLHFQECLNLRIFK